MQQNAPKSIFINFFSMEHFPQHPQKAVCNEIFTTKETCPPTLNLVYCFTGFIIFIIYRGGGGGLILHVCQYVFQNHLKSRKIYM